MHITIKRIYDDPSPDDGSRVLVDRLWPRGLSKDEAAFDLWCKDLAPSADLRRWYDHDPEQFDTFAKRYRKELLANPQPLADLLATLDKRKRLTLLTATKDLALSHATILKAFLEAHA